MGYFGIGIFNYKHSVNVGTLFRTAYNLNANFVFTIGRDYKRQASDTCDSTIHIPYLRFPSFESFLKGLPKGCIPIACEISDKSSSLFNLSHPKQCCYILGAEDNGLPKKILDKCYTVQIPTRECLNVAVAGSLIMYDRVYKEHTTKI